MSRGNTENISIVDIICQCRYQKTCDSKCLALIAQMISEFGMNPRIGGLSPPPLKSSHFLFQKLWQFRKNIRPCVEKGILLPAHSRHVKC